MAKHNVKKRSFQKECRAVNWDSVIILLLVLQLKYTSLSIHLWVYSWNKVSEQSFFTSSGILQRWWDSRVTWNRWYGFKWLNCSHCCWKFSYQQCLVCACNWHKMRWSLNQQNIDDYVIMFLNQPYILCYLKN